MKANSVGIRTGRVKFQSQLVLPVWEIDKYVFDSYKNIGFTPQGIALSQDGTKLYTLNSSDDNIYQYTLTTPWDITTINTNSAITKASPPGTGSRYPQGIFIRDDGLKMFVCDSAYDKVYELNLSTAWDLSSASYGNEYNVSSQANSPRDVFFSSDGTKMYVMNLSYIYEYTLSTAWDITTASYLNRRYTYTSSFTSNGGFYIRNDGKKMFVFFNENGTKLVKSYTLSTPWSITSASYDGLFLDVGSQTGSSIGGGPWFSSDGVNMYIGSGSYSRIIRYKVQ